MRQKEDGQRLNFLEFQPFISRNTIYIDINKVRNIIPFFDQKVTKVANGKDGRAEAGYQIA